MKTISKIATMIIIGLGVAIISSSVMAQVSINGSASASVTAREILQIEETRQTQFGTFSVGPTGGTVYTGSSDTSNNPRATGDVILKVNGIHGQIKITGEPTAHYAISLLSNTIQLSSGSSGTNMNATVTLTDATGATLPISGYKIHDVVGVLTVAGSQASGTYTGTYPVTAQYN